jgi:hypothetical protein
MEDVDKSPNRANNRFFRPKILSQGGFLNLSWNLRRQHEYVKEQPSTAGKNAKELKTPSLGKQFKEAQHEHLHSHGKIGDIC